MSSSISAPAIVCHGPLSDDKWKWDEILLPSLGDDELLIRMVATGICHTDLNVGGLPVESNTYPRVLGHEGAGYVEQAGRNVTVAQPGDPVLLSYLFCKTCYSCLDGHPGYCTESIPLNFVGEKAYALKGTEGQAVGSGFCGQSSFAGKTIAKQSAVVNMKGLVKDEEELKLFSPLGCAFNTGCATVENVAKIQPGQSIAVLGLGGVGMSAIMAAKIIGCKNIIGIDRIESRLQLAQEIGATHTLNTSEGTDLVAEIRNITGGPGVHAVFDTIGVPKLTNESIEYVRNAGSIIQIAMTSPGARWDVSMPDFMITGKSIQGAVGGDVDPHDYLPKLVGYYRDGNLPVEKIVEFYKAKDFQQALKDMRTGKTIKPVLVW